ncbi:carbon monoxide dehydrogenase subunit G [Lacibacterium aquatile]|uniref:Carbon monoxide dehydrogenase subunit G n=1 Tax=Lacibacterium aquatile TaxID=1168082 RepID=A0ABW5DNE8_9PROT
MTGDVVIPATRDAVWAALNDPEVLRQAIPGCETIEKKSDTELSAKVAVKIGPVKASFSGNVTLSDLDPPNGYRISGQGQGGAAGFAKGGATVKLEEVEGGTKLSYEADAQIGGKLAQIGSRLVDGAAKSLAAEFFNNFSTIVAGTPAVSAEEAGEEDSGEIVDSPPPPTELASPATADEAKAMDEVAEAVENAERSLPPAVWIGILLLLIGGILLVVSS